MGQRAAKEEAHGAGGRELGAGTGSDFLVGVECGGPECRLQTEPRGGIGELEAAKRSRCEV